ncbi:MAG: S26 family signal peptidase, partial [Elusimicrobiota bacterium]
MAEILVKNTIGGSMRPALKNGQPVRAEFLPFDSFRTGDMVLYKKENNHYIHRIIRKKPDYFIVDGDSAVTSQHNVYPGEILGRPVSFFNGLPGLILGNISNLAFKLGRKLKSFVLSFRFLSLLFLTSVFLLPSPVSLYAVVRVKTVEWNFGSYYSANSIASGSPWTPPYITVNLPDAIATSPIKNAYLEIEYLTTTNKGASTTNIDVFFSTGTAAGGPVDSIGGGNIPSTSRETDLLNIKVDVTSKIAYWSSQAYSMAVSITGPTSNMHSAKLYITYYYDDDPAVKATQIKTVRFPLFSNSANGISGVASSESQLTLGATFTYYAEIPETGASIKQAWFEIRGLNQASGSTNNGFINCNILTFGKEAMMTFSGVNTDSYRYRYLTSTGIPAGFSTTGMQSLNVSLSGNAASNVLGGEVVITYEFPASAGTKLKTVSYFLCQSSDTAGSPVDFTVPTFLREVGITIKRIYAFIRGSYDSTSSYSLPINSKIAGNSLTSRSYPLIITNVINSGFELYHDMSEGRSYWVDGSTVNISWTDSSALGSLGMELVITYTYTSEGKFTDFYRVFAGQTPFQQAAGATYDSSFSVFFPDPETPVGIKTLRSAFLTANFIQGNTSVSQDPGTTVNVNSAAGEARMSYHNSLTENFQAGVVYDFTKRISPSSTTATANYSLNSDPYNVSGAANILYGYMPVPIIPASLAQYKSDGATAVQTGGFTNENGARFKFTMSSRFSGDVLYPVIEIKPAISSFDGLNLSTGAPQAYSGSPLNADIFVSTGQQQYQWRASVYGTGGRSSWVNYSTPGTTHFGIDLSSPAAPALSNPLSGAATNYSTPRFTWQSVSDTGGSGTKDYLLQISTSSNFIPVYMSSQTALTSARTSQITQKLYWWRVCANDNAGNTGVFSSTWTVIVDTTPPTAVSTLNNPINNYTTNQMTLSFSWAGVTDLPAGVTTYTLQIST